MDFNNIPKSFEVNFPGIKSNVGGSDVRTDEGLRKFLVEVGVNEGEAYKIDQFFHNDIPSSKLSIEKMNWIMSYYDIISGYLLASTTNRKSGRKYDWTPLILKAYERAKSLAVVSKADEGWMTLNVLKRELVSRYQEQSNQHMSQEQKKQSWFGSKKDETNSYGTFERGT